jgi:hypothetical protein
MSLPSREHEKQQWAQRMLHRVVICIASDMMRSFLPDLFLKEP